MKKENKQDVVLEAFSKKSEASVKGTSKISSSLKFIIGVFFVFGVFAGIGSIFFHKYVQNIVERSVRENVGNLKNTLMQLRGNQSTLVQNLKKISDSVSVLQESVRGNSRLNTELSLQIKSLNEKAHQNLSRPTPKDIKVLETQSSLITRIEKGLSLKPLLSRGVLSKQVEVRLKGVEKVPTFQEVLDMWSHIKHHLIKVLDGAALTGVEGDGLLSRMKSWFVGLFHIRRIDSDYLTYGERTVQIVEELLAKRQLDDIEKIINDSFVGLGIRPLEKSISDWLAMLKLYLLGVDIIESIKSNNV